MNENQNGFLLPLLLGAAVLLALIGYAVWKGLNANNNSSQLTPQTEESLEERTDMPAYVEYESVIHSQLGFSVLLPSGWTAKEVEIDNNHEFNVYNYLELYSPDFLDEPDATYQNLEGGVMIRIIPSRVTQTNDFDSQYVYENAIKSEAVYKNKTTFLKVDGVQAVQTIFAYEGPPVYEVKFKKGDTNYSIGMRKPFEDYENLYEEFKPFTETFNFVLDSFEFDSS
ncbi:MAG TPA: hypothetical protein VF996_01820 [Candidatus Saccharimonadales bacterium]